MDRRRRGGPVLSARSAKGEVTVQQPSAAERTVARRAAEARATIPHLELTVEIDFTRALQLAAEKECSLTAILVRACALALGEHPRANGSYRDGHFELYSRINIGMVVATESSYLIPTVFEADRKPLEALSGELDELISRAKAGRLASPAFSGATFTLWDAGPHGLASASIPPVPPQAAALVSGAVRDTRSSTATLACDHRILYGAGAAAFLNVIKSRLERAEL